MGEVYRAPRHDLGRTVAIKVIPPSWPRFRSPRGFLARGPRDGGAIAPDQSPRSTNRWDQGELFLAFEFVPGETLRNVIADGRSIRARAVDFAAQIADALAEAPGQRHRAP